MFVALCVCISCFCIISNLPQDFAKHDFVYLALHNVNHVGMFLEVFIWSLIVYQVGNAFVIYSSTTTRGTSVELTITAQTSTNQPTNKTNPNQMLSISSSICLLQELSVTLRGRNGAVEPKAKGTSSKWGRCCCCLLLLLCHKSSDMSIERV